MKLKNVAVTGYYGTGSSAIIDLLSEYSTVGNTPQRSGNYEHVPFYFRGGLFDLCNRLLHGNTPLGSDAAINQFLESMQYLNDYDCGWFGGHKNLIDGKFLEACNSFVNTLAITKNSKNLNHTCGHVINKKTTLKNLFLYFLGKSNQILAYGNKFDSRPSYMALPTEEEFFEAAKQLTDSYMSSFSVPEGSEYRVFDHLLLPPHVDAFSKCFNDNLKIIVSQRDPRDAFILDKYVRSKKKEPYFSRDVKEFTVLYKRLVCPRFERPNVLKINFEELAYEYDSAVNKIETFLGISDCDHIAAKISLNPERALENTQIFRAKKEWLEEVKYIEEELPEFLYNFKYERVPDISRTF